ncbi:MAG: phytanoyl-CoA dioxygenase family protein [Pirellulales bacterium]
MADLAARHELVSDLFSIPKSADQWQRFALSQSQIDSFHEQGYLAGVQILNAEQVERLREEVTRLMDPDHPRRDLWYEYHSNESSDPSTILFHALGGWRIEPGMHDSLWNPAFTVPASQLLGGAVRFWHDQLFCKPARHGGVVAWHQDYSYWTRTRPLAHLTCWIGLDDSTRDNGCVCYVPGSHRWDLLPITGLAGDMESIRQVLTDEQWEQFQKPVFAELKAGQAVFHHALTIHGSFANRTERPRRAMVLNVVRDGVASASNDSLLAGVPGIPSGQPLGGKFFPLLLDQPHAQGIHPAK